MIKTFRGLIADDTQDTIVLHTNDGSTGYRIAKFEIITTTPVTVTTEAVMKIWKVSQTTITTSIDFSDQTLLAAAVWASNASADVNPFNSSVIFDKEIFNQDIYVTFMTGVGSAKCNYYIELEQVKLDLSESTVATLKDIRNELRIPPG